MIDHREWTFCARYIDQCIEAFKAEIWNGLLSLQKRQPPKQDESGAYSCPGCGSMISAEHAEHYPNYCENCGQAYDWGGDPEV